MKDSGTVVQQFISMRDLNGSWEGTYPQAKEEQQFHIQHLTNIQMCPQPQSP